MSRIEHGGRLDAAIARWGGERAEWLDLSTGINRRHYPVGGVPNDVWLGLPDEGALARLVASARSAYSVGERFDIVPANGTQALLQVLPQVMASRLKRNASRSVITVAILGPTYNEHRLCWERLPDTAVDEVSSIDHATNHDVIVVVNPNNPDGRLIAPDLLEDVARRQKERGGFLIVDEAFCDLYPNASVAGGDLENVIILKSVGKFFGLAGLRLGFAVCNADISSELAAVLGPWCVSGPALELGARALHDKNWISQNRDFIVSKSARQEKLLCGAGMKVVGNAGLFMLIEDKSARELHDRLAKRHVLTRTFDYAPSWLRLGLCRDETELSRLDESLSDALASIGGLNG